MVYGSKRHHWVISLHAIDAGLSHGLSTGSLHLLDPLESGASRLEWTLNAELLQLTLPLLPVKRRARFILWQLASFLGEVLPLLPLQLLPGVHRLQPRHRFHGAIP